jgi:hypothetical protein
MSAGSRRRIVEHDWGLLLACKRAGGRRRHGQTVIRLPQHAPHGGALLHATERRVRTTAPLASTYTSGCRTKLRKFPISGPTCRPAGVPSLVLGAYQRHGAITGSRSKPVLEETHVGPVDDGGIHGVDNGLLRSSDVHALFDDGYLGVERPLPAACQPSPEAASPATGSNSVSARAWDTRPRCPRTASTARAPDPDLAHAHGVQVRPDRGPSNIWRGAPWT